MSNLSQPPTLTTLHSDGGSSGPDRASSSDTLTEGRFVPGVILGGRYRIIGLLGTGGMGEVYRANDLKLGQPVALKFLPEALANDQTRISRFFNEVRIARQIAHPNVCRVYDLGEADGMHFLSMEYVDGEDLASLLRRIGRMPQDRAIQIARQLCAGLAAAHQQGFLHRDLKPANVMIDGRGRARITDFGLAAAVHGIAPREVRVGTPAYMAPEQLAGREVSVKSDVYSLGLVLYELFTGTAPFKGDSPAELMRTQQEASPPSPSSFVNGIEPAVERAILRCLESDPRHRPASALAVAASLPGGDPLAAALAAGETPSPEMVADAGEVGGLRPGVGSAFLAIILLALLALAWISERTQMLQRIDLPKPPEALMVESRELIESLGYREPPVDEVHGFELDEDYLLYVHEHDASSHRWDSLRTARPSPVSFWYRQSPRYLVPVSAANFVEPWNPPANISGMVNVQLDPAGRLTQLLAVPPQLDESDTPNTPADWPIVFRAAGLQMDRFSETRPVWNPPINCGTRQAWMGEYPDQPGVAIRVEACSYAGKPSFFAVIPPWSKPRRMEVVRASGAQRFVSGIFLFLVSSLVLAGILLARRNLRLGRSDGRGALRVALVVFAANFVYGLLRVNHVSDFHEAAILVRGASTSLFAATLVWLIYIALEPAVRRMWPDVLISWNRLLAGRYRDPLVGHDLLVGGVAGVSACLVLSALNLAGGWLGAPESEPFRSVLDPLIGLRQALGIWIGSQVGTLAQPIGLLFLVLLLRVLLRKQWAAVGVTVLLFAGIGTLVSIEPSAAFTGSQVTHALVVLLVASAVWTIIVTVLIRSGLLATIYLSLVFNAVFAFPPTVDFSSWYAARSWIGVAGVAAIAVYAFTIARAGRRVRSWDELLSH